VISPKILENFEEENKTAKEPRIKNDCSQLM
jgi:hypothetical protein